MREGEKSLALLREKLEHHRRELVLATDPDIKFALKKRIEEIEATVVSWSNVGLATNPDTNTNARDEIAELTTELRRREADDEDATEILEALLHAHRHKREGLALRPSEVLMDRYQLDAVAGAGGFATVWQAWDRVENRKVAVKVLHHQHTANQSLVERFFSGARQLAKLDHPGLVRVLVEQAIDPAGHHFFVMTWHSGGDLAHAIKERSMTTHAALRALARVAEALDHAHAHGMIHRDVKPANILLDESGQATLADFDLVDALDTTHGTKTSAGMGTFKYAAPEQLEDAAHVDARADVYGLGMTALYCLLGRDPPALVAATEPELLEGLECAPALREAIRRAVAYKAEKRPSGCAELASALREPKFPVPEPRVPVSPRPPIAKIVGIGAAVVVLVIGGFGLSQVFGGKKVDLAPTGSALGVMHMALAGTKAPMQVIGLTGGEFTMGSPSGEGARYTDEGPQHRVMVSPFGMCATEVSLAQYELVMGKDERPNDCKVEGCDDQHPVTRVSWEDALRFLNALTRRENEQGAKLTLCYDETTWAWDRSCTGYRLPSEAEWEYAARAGTTTPWSFGSNAQDLCKHANTGTDACDDGFAPLAPVETSKLQPNAWGLHGMHGNAYEWVFDVYAPYTEPRVENPVVTSDGNADASDDARVLRGGSFSDWSQNTRSAFRSRKQPENRYRSYGFRCARGAVPQP